MIIAVLGPHCCALARVISVTREHLRHSPLHAPPAPAPATEMMFLVPDKNNWFQVDNNFYIMYISIAHLETTRYLLKKNIKKKNTQEKRSQYLP